MTRRSDRPASRRDRRARPIAGEAFKTSRLDLPGPLRYLTDPKLFAAVALVFAGAIILSLFVGMLGVGNPVTDSGQPQQGNEAPDVPPEDAASGQSTPVTNATPATVKRYSSSPAMVITPGKRYLATVKTPKGDIQIELDADQAPEAVNAFVFLARDGYYNGTPFMQLVKNPDGSKFTVQAGDPTRTGLGTPGFSVKKEQTARPFAKGAVGTGGTAQDSNGGQFFISLGDYPALNGKYTIFGQVVSGLDVVDQLSLLVPTQGTTAGSGDEIQSVTISES